MKLDTIIIFTPQMRALADFYRQGLGYEGELQERPGHIGFALENGLYVGFDQAEIPTCEGGVSLWFAVENMDLAFERFVAAGARVRYAKRQLPIGDVLASLYDLDGNILGLVER